MLKNRKTKPAVHFALPRRIIAIKANTIKTMLAIVRGRAELYTATPDAADLRKFILDFILTN
jgi:hypothetical protein